MIPCFLSHEGNSTAIAPCSTPSRIRRWTDGGRPSCAATSADALRFKDAGGSNFLTSTGKRVPPVVDLPRLLSATNRIIDDNETDEDLQLILTPGTSLGGARPKASVRDQVPAQGR